MATKAPTKMLPKSAITGRIVTPQYAKAHPNTTVVQRVPVGKPSKPTK